MCVSELCVDKQLCVCGQVVCVSELCVDKLCVSVSELCGCVSVWEGRRRRGGGGEGGGGRR